MAGKIHQWTEAGVKEWNRIRAKVDGLRGAGVRNDRETITIGPEVGGGKSSPAAAPAPDLIIPQYAGMFLGAPVANQLAACFVFATNSV